MYNVVVEICFCQKHYKANETCERRVADWESPKEKTGCRPCLILIFFLGIMYPTLPFWTWHIWHGMDGWRMMDEYGYIEDGWMKYIQVGWWMDGGWKGGWGCWWATADVIVHLREKWYILGTPMQIDFGLELTKLHWRRTPHTISFLGTKLIDHTRSASIECPIWFAWLSKCCIAIALVEEKGGQHP